MILLTYMYTKANFPPPPPSISFGEISVLDEVGATVKSCTRHADSGVSRGGARGARPPLFLDQTEARRAEKKFFSRPPPSPYLRVWMTGPPPYLRSGSATARCALTIS